MPVAEIPGYFYDEEKKRYFKIMPSGSYSMAAIQQANRQRKKLQQQQQKEKVRLSRRKRFDSTSMLTFQRQRSIYPFLPTRTLVGYGSKSMYTQLKCQGQMQLGLLENTSDNNNNNNNNNNAMATNMVVNSHTSLQQQEHFGDTYGDIMIGHRGGLTRYGFQVEPFFQAWKTSQTWHKSTNITSLHFIPPSRGHTATSFGYDWTQSVVGTSMGDDMTLPNQLWRYTLPLAPRIDESTAERLLNNNRNIGRHTNRITPALDHDLLPEAIWDCSFVRRKDTFWSSYVADTHNIILVGGEKDLFILSSSFDFISQVPSKSAVFATHLSEQQPKVAWIGCRDGRILLVDSRQNAQTSEKKHLMGNLQFRQGSAITHLKPLDNYSSGHSLLATGMDGSISLWDTRFSIPATTSKSARRHGKKSHQENQVSQPIRHFYGHSNNHSRQLAFDVDTNLRLMTVAGDDNVVRLWSLSDQENEVHPFWSSKTYDGQICQARIMARPPPVQNIWSSLDDGNGDGLPTFKRSNPGLLVCAPSPSLEWFSIPH